MIRILFQRAYNVFIILFWVFMIPCSVHATTAYQIMAKAALKYTSLQTFQAEYKMSVYLNQHEEITSIMYIKAEPSKGRFYDKSEDNSREVNGTIDKLVSIDTDDGVNLTDYQVEDNSYSITRNSTDNNYEDILLWFGMERIHHQIRTRRNVKYKLLSSGFVGSHSVYVIQMEEPAAGHYPHSISKIYIDKKLYIMRKITGKFCGNSKVIVNVNMISYQINRPISDSIFYFVLPKGATPEPKIHILIPGKSTFSVYHKP